MGCNCFPRVPGKKYVAKEKRYLASPLLEETSKAGRQQPHSTALYWCGTLLVWVLISLFMSLVSEGGWVDGLQCEHKCSPSLVKEKSECDLENVAIKGLGFAFFPPTLFLSPHLAWIHRSGCRSSKVWALCGRELVYTCPFVSSWPTELFRDKKLWLF